MSLRTRVLACSAALAAFVLVAIPASRSFASGVASRIVHLRPAVTQGPIPFILDLQKHKRAHKPPVKPRGAKPPGKVEGPRPKA